MLKSEISTNLHCDDWARYWRQLSEEILGNMETFLKFPKVIAIMGRLNVIIGKEVEWCQFMSPFLQGMQGLKFTGCGDLNGTWVKYVIHKIIGVRMVTICFFFNTILIGKHKDGYCFNGMMMEKNRMLQPWLIVVWGGLSCHEFEQEERANMIYSKSLPVSPAAGCHGMRFFGF